MSTHEAPAPLELYRLAPEGYAAQRRFDQVSWEQFGDPRLAELCRMRVSQLNGCAYCLDLHHREARAAGVPERQLHVLAGWRESPLFDARDRAALALAEATTRPEQGLERHVRAAREHFGDRELAGLVLGLAAIGTWNRLALAAGSSLPVEDDAAERAAGQVLGRALAGAAR